MNDRPTGAGSSSFDLVETSELFRALSLQADSAFLDLACGSGQYALEAARHITEKGVIYAVDLWPEGIAALRSEARARGIKQIQPRVADVSKRIPVEDHTIDICLMATVLHDLVRDGTHVDAIQEITRVLKPSGKLAVVEFKKMAGPPGPPIEVRLSPAEVETLLRAHSFDLERTLNIGPHNYISMFAVDRNSRPEDRSTLNLRILPRDRSGA